MRAPGPIVAILLVAACGGGTTDNPKPEDHLDAGEPDGSAPDHL